MNLWCPRQTTNMDPVSDFLLKNNERDGRWERYDKEGNLIKTEDYKDGELIE